MNLCIIEGRLTKDPETRATQSGVTNTNFTVAVNRYSQEKKTTDYLPIVAWRNLAENCARYLKKGSRVLVQGSIQTRSYDGNDGVKRYVTEILADKVDFLDKKEEEKIEKFEQIPGFAVVEQDDLPF